MGLCCPLWLTSPREYSIAVIYTIKIHLEHYTVSTVSMDLDGTPELGCCIWRGGNMLYKLTGVC